MPLYNTLPITLCCSRVILYPYENGDNTRSTCTQSTVRSSTECVEQNSQKKKKKKTDSSNCASNNAATNQVLGILHPDPRTGVCNILVIFTCFKSHSRRTLGGAMTDRAVCHEQRHLTFEAMPRVYG